MSTVRAARAALLFAFALTGCSGGGTATPPAASAATVTSGNARGTATIVIPARGKSIASGRRAKWVSPSTQSIYMTVTRESDHVSTAAYARDDAHRPELYPGQRWFDHLHGPVLGAARRDDVAIFAVEIHPDPAPWVRPVHLSEERRSRSRPASDNSMSFVMGGIVATSAGVHASHRGRRSRRAAARRT